LSPAFPPRGNVHRTYMGAVERGERNLTLQTLERLAEALEVPVGSLLISDGMSSTAEGADAAANERRGRAAS